MTQNKKIVYIDVETEDIPTFYLLNKKYKLVKQIIDQVQSGRELK
jgi:hypothetical protein